MREERVRDWCDVCLQEARRQEAVHLDVRASVTGAPRRSLDLCDQHYRKLIKPLQRVLRTGKINPSRPPTRAAKRRRQGPFQCQVKGCPAPPLKHTSTLWQHLKGVHHITISEYKEKYGELVAMTPAELEALVVEARCEHCEQVYSTALGHRFPHIALKAHLRARHGIMA